MNYLMRRILLILLDMNTANDKVQILTAKINYEQDAVKKQKLQKDLVKLRLRIEIEKLRGRLDGMG